MENEQTYIMSEKQCNKFWSYKISGSYGVLCKWGRIGESTREKLFQFGNAYDLNNFIEKKITEKLKKRYNKIDKQKLKEESNVAQILGTRNKIKRILWVKKEGNNKLKELDNYSPNDYIYVEVLNSWKKNITRLLLDKDSSWEIYSSIIESNGVLTYDDMGIVDSGNNNFVTGIREVLRKMSIQVVEIVSSMNFGLSGKRDLFGLGNNKQNKKDVNDNLKKLDTTGFDSSVISKFATLGQRALIFN